MSFRRCFALLCCAVLPTLTSAATSAANPGFVVPIGADRLRVERIDDGIVRVSYRVGDRAPVASVVIDPAFAARLPDASPGAGDRLDTPALHVRWDATAHALVVGDAQGRELLRQHAPAAGRLDFEQAAAAPVYGIGGRATALKQDIGGGLIQQGPVRATAGEQGHAGAPLAWTANGYALLVDQVGVDFAIDGRRIQAGVDPGSGDYYIIAGDPHAVFAAVNRISGATPLFPKWAMGFTNSQWGIDEKELIGIVDTYRAKHIPIDNITLDFDWKAWSEDMGEFRWNPAKFPDAPSGKLKSMLAAKGVHLTGIMKPRVHLDTREGREAAERGYFIANVPAKDDYFSHKRVRDIDFDQAAARRWFFNDALKRSFATGIDGWWNDEADTTGDDLQHFNMQRALYDGQRAIPNQRVWSISRNFYLGAQRYAYGLWSGDIPTGFESMAIQRTRMLQAIDVDAMQWGMDGGGFSHGTPTPENYARWIEFGAFTPVFRVHGELGQKRQPWRYGPVAERAATDAIRLRYRLIPYVYSYEYARRTTGIGLVRPLLMDWPDDAQVRNDTDSWLFGDSLLVSPVVAAGQTSKDIYLPAGRWTGWFDGKVYDGRRTVHVPVDAKTWRDIPLFVREGAIIPLGPVLDHVDQAPITELAVEMFPAAQEHAFTYYDDDGLTYDYEHGADFRQTLHAIHQNDRIRVRIDAARGSFRPALKTWLLKIHGGNANAVQSNGQPLARVEDAKDFEAGHAQGWASGTDRFGPVTLVRVPAGQAVALDIAGAAH